MPLQNSDFWILPFQNLKFSRLHHLRRIKLVDPASECGAKVYDKWAPPSWVANAFDECNIELEVLLTWSYPHHERSMAFETEFQQIQGVNSGTTFGVFFT